MTVSRKVTLTSTSDPTKGSNFLLLEVKWNQCLKLALHVAFYWGGGSVTEQPVVGFLTSNGARAKGVRTGFRGSRSGNRGSICFQGLSKNTKTIHRPSSEPASSPHPPTHHQCPSTFHHILLNGELKLWVWLRIVWQNVVVFRRNLMALSAGSNMEAGGLS
jgi:hypothetical protein